MDVIVERAGAIMVCTLNRPKSANSITPGIFSELLTAFQEAERDDGINVIVTRANGREFCVGADAANLNDWTRKSLTAVFQEDFEGRQGLDSLGGDRSQAFDPLGMNRWADAVSQIKVPMIAAIHGVAAGGGLGIALLHHFRFADTNAKFCTAFAQLGLSAELGVSYLLPSLVGQQKSLDMLLTNRVVIAEEALDMGLIDHLVEPGLLDEAVMKYAERIASQAPLAIRASLDAHMQIHRTALQQAMQREWQRQKVLWLTQDFKEGARALYERRPPRFQGR